MTILKRDGRKVPFDSDKIKTAIEKALKATNVSLDLSNEITDITISKIKSKLHDKTPTVETVQDFVEESLLELQLIETARAYIVYRERRSNVREANTNLMHAYKEIAFSKSNNSDLKRENANINSDTAMGAMLKYGSEGAKEFNKHFILPPKYSELHNNGDIHIHDLDFYTLTTTCTQIDLTRLFNGGFQTGHGTVREPQGIRSYSSLACIAIQSNQNDQHGGQSIANFDFDLAPGVRKTYVKHFTKYLEKIYKVKKIDINARKQLELLKQDYGVIPAYLNDDISLHFDKEVYEFVSAFAKEETENDTLQAMESLIHNLNTMHSRAGAQVPFSSINYGLDTSNEGRLLVSKLLEATIRGLGNGETPIFPIQIYKIKEEINYNENDPNYDLFLKAIECSSQRLFPNFAFVDAPFNLEYYKENDIKTHIAYMGCRTRVIANIDKDHEQTTSRGNLSFTSINLPRLAILNKSVPNFFLALDKMLENVIEQLLSRYDLQKKMHVYNFPFLMGQGVWLGSENLNYNDTLESVLKHGTLTVGFIGLAETLKVLIGKHHGESEKAQELGLKIVSFMREKVDDACKKYQLNFSLIATPAEGLSGRFVKIDKERFGIIDGVTNHDFYTNSFHVPVYFTLPAYKKIDIEAPYHRLTNGGHITYIELDGNVSKNTDAFLKVIRYMKEKNIGYGSINHSVDFDPVCGYRGIINSECPRCGRKETEDLKFVRIRRITGYLVGGLDFFNNAKRSEVNERVKHKA